MIEQALVYFFGCISPERLGHRLYPDGSYRDTPWGAALDGRLAPGGLVGYACDSTPDGRTAFHQKDGWSAVSFWDRSGDRRPASNSTFLVHALVSEEELLRLAQEQWPELFSRPGFPLPERAQS